MRMCSTQACVRLPCPSAYGFWSAVLKLAYCELVLTMYYYICITIYYKYQCIYVEGSRRTALTVGRDSIEDEVRAAKKAQTDAQCSFTLASPMACGSAINFAAYPACLQRCISNQADPT
ncbi:hypothetical protein ABBQ38_005298 [Trebouxia sp. C0009 RCD-2024]